MKTSLRCMFLLVGALLLIVPAVGCASGNSATESTEFSLTGVNWRWESMTVRGAEGEDVTTVSDPSLYTVVVNEDGTLNGQADCNVYGGSYTTEQGGIQIALGPTTTAFCGDQSLDQVFLQSLSMVVAGGSDGTGKLALESGGGERRMIFADGGAPPSQ